MKLNSVNYPVFPSCAEQQQDTIRPTGWEMNFIEISDIWVQLKGTLWFSAASNCVWFRCSHNQLIWAYVFRNFRRLIVFWSFASNRLNVLAFLSGDMWNFAHKFHLLRDSVRYRYQFFRPNWHFVTSTIYQSAIGWFDDVFYIMRAYACMYIKSFGILELRFTVIRRTNIFLQTVGRLLRCM